MHLPLFRYLEVGNFPELHTEKLDISDVVMLVSTLKLTLHTLGLINCTISGNMMKTLKTLKGKLQHVNFWQCSSDLKRGLTGISSDVVVKETYKASVTSISVSQI